MRIAELARRAGVSTPTLRFYEEQGLLAPAARSEAGYREYGAWALGRLGFIRRAKALGLSLREVRSLLESPGDSVTDHARLRGAAAHQLTATRRPASARRTPRPLQGGAGERGRGSPPSGWTTCPASALIDPKVAGRDGRREIGGEVLGLGRATVGERALGFERDRLAGPQRAP